jgi:ribulose-5-phosphate 4-epimerase/fuculose-1-phosphate aldolase
VQPFDRETQLLKACRRLTEKGLLALPSDSISIRIPGTVEMLLVTGVQDWHAIGTAFVSTRSFTSQWGVSALHGVVYRERADVGAITISNPPGVRLLASLGEVLPSLFDEQARHIGRFHRSFSEDGIASAEQIHGALRSGGNAVLLGERLLCLGMTCDRVVSNTDLVEKCARAYLISRAAGADCKPIPAWVRLIANRRLLKEEAKAGAMHLRGELPDAVSAY